MRKIAISVEKGSIEGQSPNSSIKALILPFDSNDS